MREPKAPEYESVDADLALDFAARKERAEILMCRLEAVRKKQLERDAAHVLHPAPEITP